MSLYKKLIKNITTIIELWHYRVMGFLFNLVYEIIRKITIIIFFISTMLIIILAPIVYTITPEKILEGYIKSSLKDNNIDDLNFKISHLSTNKLIIENINFSDFNEKEEVKIGAISANYDISDFPRININYISFEQININAKTNEKGILSFGNIEKIIAKLSNTESSHKNSNINDNTIENFLEKNLTINSIIANNSYIYLSSPKNKASIPFAFQANIAKNSKLSNLYEDMTIDLKIYESIFNLQDFNIPSTGYISTDIYLKGNFPINFEGKKPRITDGIVTSYEKGYIKFKSSLPNNNNNMDTLIKSLSNYNYKTISADINSNKDGKLTLGLSIDGNNNDMYGKRNIELNVNLSVNMFKILKSFLDVYKISDFKNKILSKDIF